MKIDRSQSGFTLIEILVAAAILALLSAALVPLVITQVQKGRTSRTQSDARNVGLAFTQYYADTGQWPCTWTGTANLSEQLVTYTCLYSNTSNLPGWNGPYLNKGVTVGKAMQVASKNSAGKYDGLVDAWGSPYQVVLHKPDPTKPGEAGGVILLMSPGSDLKIATKDDDAISEKPAGDDTVHLVTRKVN